MDNIILVQEEIHSSRQQKGSSMIIKLDMANAFDRLNHQYLFKVLKLFGFGDKLISWINVCIGKPCIAPLVNGRVTKLFKTSRGIRQGCSLSPLLYIIIADSLSITLEWARLKWKIKGIQNSKTMKEINHPQIENDTLL